jgi:hypothetical protein
MPRPLYPSGERVPGIHWLEEAGWASEPVWTTWRSENSFPRRDSNSDPLVVQPVASRYTGSLTQEVNIQYIYIEFIIPAWILYGD